MLIFFYLSSSMRRMILQMQNNVRFSKTDKVFYRILTNISCKVNEF
jgi:hypothetical protein